MAHIYLVALAEHERQKRELKANRLFLRQRSEPLSLPEAEFKKNFRLSRNQFRILCEELKPHMVVERRSTAVKPEIKILAAIAFYGNGSYQKNVGAYYHLGLSQTMVSRAITEVTNALNLPEVFSKYIKFPTNIQEREENRRRFMELFGFPGVLGAIDGTHVAIICPIIDEEAYLNRKLFHSLNVMVVCDADLRIIFINSSFSGATHDSHIWNMSELRTYLSNLSRNGEQCWLLGDSGYAQSEIMMTPILNAAPGSPEEHYTKCQVQARNVVERCFGVLKTRWRCLLSHRTLHYCPVKAGKIVNACAVLHNICREDALRYDANASPQAPAPEPQANAAFVDNEARRQLVQRLWNSRT